MSAMSRELALRLAALELELTTTRAEIDRLREQTDAVVGLLLAVVALDRKITPTDPLDTVRRFVDNLPNAYPTHLFGIVPDSAPEWPETADDDEDGSSEPEDPDPITTDELAGLPRSAFLGGRS
jgi:hypothetical protein